MIRKHYQKTMGEVREFFDEEDYPDLNKLFGFTDSSSNFKIDIRRVLELKISTYDKLRAILYFCSSRVQHELAIWIALRALECYKSDNYRAFECGVAFDAIMAKKAWLNKEIGANSLDEKHRAMYPYGWVEDSNGDERWEPLLGAAYYASMSGGMAAAMGAAGAYCNSFVEYKLKYQECVDRLKEMIEE